MLFITFLSKIAESFMKRSNFTQGIFSKIVIVLLNFGLLPYANEVWRHIFQILKNITDQ